MKIEHSDKVTDKPKRRCVSPRNALTSRRTTQYFWSAPHGHVRENGHAGNRKCVIFINGIKEKWSLSVWKASVKLSVLERARFLFFTSTRGTNDQLFNKKKTQSRTIEKKLIRSKWEIEKHKQSHHLIFPAKFTVQWLKGLQLIRLDLPVDCVCHRAYEKAPTTYCLW